MQAAPGESAAHRSTGESRHDWNARMHTWSHPVRIRRSTTVPVLAALLGLAGIAVPAHADPTPTTVVTDVVGPLGLAVGHDGSIYVAEAFSGMLTRVTRSGKKTTRTTLVANGTEIAGVDATGKGNVVYVESSYEEPGEPGGEPGSLLDSFLGTVTPRGTSSRVASLFDHESTTNPDGDVAYGFQDVDDDCLALLPDEVPPPYTGIVDSHPYAVAIVAGGWAVADAAGNDIVRVDRRGRATTVAVLPRVENVIDEGLAAAFGLDPCFVGATFWGESVPTDVEVGPDGDWYVTSLPGGPELPGSGSVWRVDPATGATTMVATGLTSAVDLAVADDGTIYVAELFANQVSRIVDGAVTPWASLSMPGAIEVGPDGMVYATVDAMGVGSVVRMAP